MIKERNRCFFCEEMFDTNDMSTFIQDFSGRYIRNWVCGDQKCIIERNKHENSIIKMIDIKKGGEKMVKTELTISQKLLEIQRKVSKMSFKHDKSVAFGTTRYNYFSFEYLWKKICPLLLEQGLLLTFQTYDQPINSISTTEMGFVAKMVLGMKILDTKTGNTETFFQLASSSDKKDPNFAIGGATTYAKRYLLMNIFGIADLEKTAEEKAVEKGKSNEGYIWKKY